MKIEKTAYFFFASFLVVAPVRILRKLLMKEFVSKSYTTTLPPRLLNEFLIKLFSLEIKSIDNFALPLGTTLYAVVLKKHEKR